MTYDTTFTLDDGVTTATFKKRPREMEIGFQLNIAEHAIPGRTESVIQHLGRNSRKFRFGVVLYDVLQHTITGGTVRPQNFLRQIETWAETGTPLTFISDYVTQGLGEASGITVLITGYNNVRETPVGDGQASTVANKIANYEFEIELTTYVGGI